MSKGHEDRSKAKRSAIETLNGLKLRYERFVDPSYPMAATPPGLRSTPATIKRPDHSEPTLAEY